MPGTFPRASASRAAIMSAFATRRETKVNPASAPPCVLNANRSSLTWSLPTPRTVGLSTTSIEAPKNWLAWLRSRATSTLASSDWQKTT